MAKQRGGGGRERSPREPGGRSRGDAGHTNPPPGEDTPTEPTLNELLARSDALRRTAELLTRRMEELAAQIDAAAMRGRR